MSDTNEQSFIRWQKFRIEQLGYVNNLLIFLATGMLAFQVQLAVKELCFTNWTNILLHSLRYYFFYP